MKTRKLLLLKLLSLLLFCAGNDVQAIVKQKPIFIFVHGLFDNHTQVKPFQDILCEIGYKRPVVSFDFDDAWYSPFIQSLEKPFKSSLGQDDEIETLYSVYQEVINQFTQSNAPVPPIILIGVSRGASLVINFLATKKPAYVVGAICESPFDTLENVLEIRCKKYKHIALLLFKNYNKNGIKPANVINAIDPHIDILFIASKEDTTVPYQLTVALYRSFIQNGNRPYSDLLLFPFGKHAKLLKRNKSFYKEKIITFLASVGC
jgi:predicted esterase